MAFIESISDTNDAGPRGTSRGVFAHRPAVYAAWRQLLGCDHSGDGRAACTSSDAGRGRQPALELLLRWHTDWCCSSATCRRPSCSTLALEPDSAPPQPCGVRSDASCDARSSRMRQPVSADDVHELRELGLSDAEIFDVAAARGRSLLLQQDPRCARRATRPASIGAAAGAARGFASRGRPIAASRIRGRIDLAANTQSTSSPRRVSAKGEIDAVRPTHDPVDRRGRSLRTGLADQRRYGDLIARPDGLAGASSSSARPG